MVLWSPSVADAVVIASIALGIAAGAAISLAEARRYLRVDDIVRATKWKRKAVNTYKPVSKPDAGVEELTPDDLEFVNAYRPAANFLNERTRSGAWSFQDKHEIESVPDAFGRYGVNYGKVRRHIEVRWAGEITGRITIEARRYDEDSDLSISVELSLNNARLYDFGQVLLLCDDLALLVSTDAADWERKQGLVIQSMVSSMWQIGPDATGNPPLVLEFTGNGQLFEDFTNKRGSSEAKPRQLLRKEKVDRG